MSLISRNNPKLKTGGFTLLEVVIALAVLSFIAIGIYQATIETYRLRDVLSVEGDFYNSIRLTSGIMQRDIALLYSPLAAFPAKKTVDPNNPGVPPPQYSTSAGGDDLSQSSKFWSPATDSSGIRPSHFIGDESKLSFISLSHIRIYRDAPESEFAKITYEVRRDDKNRDLPGTMVLVKTENPNAFSLDEFKDSSSVSYELLRGIKKISYTYYQREGNTWKKSRSWDSDKEETKNIYPDVIEMNVEVVGPKNLKFDGIFKFRPEIPLNGLDPST